MRVKRLCLDLHAKAGFILLFICLLCFFPLPAQAQDFTINDFSANILVNPDSSFTVKETLTVEFHQPRHGIYREIPYIYTDSLGSSVKTPIKVLSVTNGEGNKLKAKVTRSGNIINIRIGDPDSYVSGLQKYEIFYKVENAVLFFEDHDELYWNVTGNAWKAEIRHAECTVSLAGEKTKEFRAACYTGRTGSSEKACTYSSADNFIEFRTERSLSAGEGLTIAYGWDKGLVSPPSSFRKFLWLINLEQNWVFILPLLITDRHDSPVVPHREGPKGQGVGDCYVRAAAIQQCSLSALLKSARSWMRPLMPET